jgi:D-alanine-D-alanine ligase-like ATP-grasp enzyme
MVLKNHDLVDYNTKKICTHINKRLMRKINIIINDVLDNIYYKTTKTNTFRIIGFDIIFDDNENGYFIECNSMPDIDYANQILKKFVDDNVYKLINYGIKNSVTCCSSAH